MVLTKQMQSVLNTVSDDWERNDMYELIGGESVRACIRNGNLLAFSLGLLVSCVLPQSWLVIIIAVILALTAVICARRCRF